MNAYNKTYLNDAMRSLAILFDYSINNCDMTPTEISHLFTSSYLCEQFERANPSIIGGSSGVELTVRLLEHRLKLRLRDSGSLEKTPEYWAGYYLAYYQWAKARRFKDIFKKVPLEEIIKMYHPYHEMDLDHFVEEMDRRYFANGTDTKLKLAREAIGYSQNDLASISGVNIRSIQLYEQRINDIDKAQGHTLYKLSLALKCHVEDLLENPELDK